MARCQPDKQPMMPLRPDLLLPLLSTVSRVLRFSAPVAIAVAGALTGTLALGMAAGVYAAGMDDPVPDMQMAQSVPVWEPGDPVPGSATLPNMKEAMPDVPVATPSPSPAPSPAAATASEAEDPQDFLCNRAPAGKTVPVPPPFNRWLVRVCAPQGQALVPVLGEAWVAHGSADPVSILAMPPGAVPPPNIGAFDARYDIRFDALEGGEATGERLKRALGLLRTATSASETAPQADAVWQLDAVSNVAGTRYNLFFYLAGERPHRIIACLDQCRQALYLDVLTGAEAEHVLGR
ncbi:hypothetical protein Plav_0486 [Parvibaculum lavamentivorans DS-1]|uniref:Uncharacterized protein n=2 Tax=Parvibaculum lavamentivorans TaxID=256618 RepID=A7HQC6_PARL1|nr:hypothetical protein Plav_0486 [Parvibaculum lavamentivorans DS-1]